MNQTMTVVGKNVTTKTQANVTISRLTDRPASNQIAWPRALADSMKAVVSGAVVSRGFPEALERRKLDYAAELCAVKREPAI